MPYCAAFGCVNQSYRKDREKTEVVKKLKITFHRFPKDGARRAAWVKAVHRENWTPNSASVLCSSHFTKDCFDSTSLAVVRLKEHAVPSVFPAFPENLQKKVQQLKKQHDAEFEKQQEAESKKQQELAYQKRCKLLGVVEGRTKTEQIYGEETLFVQQGLLPPNLCRICAQFSNDLLPIFGKEAHNVELVMKIHTHLPIMVTEDDVLPINVCGGCLKNLEVCHSLVNTCLNADATLRRMLGLPFEQDVVASPTSNNIKQSVPLLSVTTLDNQTPPPTIMKTPVIPQNGVVEGQNIFPSCPPSCLIVTEDGQVQMLQKSDDDATIPKKVPANETSAKKTVVVSGIKQSSRKTNNYCDICNIHFNCRKKYLQHKVDAQCTYQCSYCNRNFRDEFRKVEHERLHSGERPYVCTACGKTFRDDSVLQRHIEVHLNRTYACEECGRVYNNRSGLYWHTWTHRNATYLCPICGELVRKGSGSYLHRLKHSSTCRRCGQKFDNWKELEEHEKIKHNFCPNKCNCCVKTPKESYRYPHLVPSSCVDPWNCGFCPRTFGTLGALNVHMAIKHKYRCFDCRKFFKDEDELNTHKQMHYQEVNLKVEDNNPLQPSDYSHKVSHHNEAPAPVQNHELSFYMCNVCGQIFMCEQQYNTHVINCAGVHCLECPTCGKVLKNKYRLLVHKQVHTGQKPYRCNICCKRFSFVNLLKKHCAISHSVPVNMSHSLL